MSNNLCPDETPGLLIWIQSICIWHFGCDRRAKGLCFLVPTGVGTRSIEQNHGGGGGGFGGNQMSDGIGRAGAGGGYGSVG